MTHPTSTAQSQVALTCVHCGEKLRRRDTPLGGRYRYERANTPDTATLGSGSECAKNERGHEVERCGAPTVAGPGAGIPATCRQERPCPIHDNPALNEVRA